MIKNFELDMNLRSLKDFFMLNIRRDAWEVEQILYEHNNGKYQGIDDLENELSKPLNRWEIAIRTVYYELMSIIEYEFRKIGAEIAISLNNAGIKKLIPKNFMEIKLNEIMIFISKTCKIDLPKIPNYETIKEIIDIANSYKHRKGLKRFKEMKKVPDYQQLDTDNALKAIDDTRKFLYEIKKSVSKKI